MQRDTHGFSMIEFLVGTVIVVMLLLASSTMLKPLYQSNRRARLLSSMIKIENEIRNGVYTQTNYTDYSKFEITFGEANVLLAKHQRVLYVNEDLSASSPNKIYPIKTVLEVVPYGAGETGVLYQVSTWEPGVALAALGVPRWPEDTADKTDFLLSASRGYDADQIDSSYASITIPKALTEATMQGCPNGFMKGVTHTKSVMCWNMAEVTSCPSWSVPVGYRMNASTSQIEILCQKLNQIACPSLDISIIDPTTNAPRTVTLPNFFVLKELKVADLYPPQSTRTGSSQCERVIDFTTLTSNQNDNGIIPAQKVNENQIVGMGAVCPDQNLYKKNPDGSCTPTFSVGNVPLRKPASILQNTINLKAAGASP